MLVVVLVFVLPSRLEAGRPAPALLDWTTVEQKLPWGVILLLGGGFALADITDKGGRAVSCMCELLLASLTIFLHYKQKMIDFHPMSL